jgi:hypothetical protein
MKHTPFNPVHGPINLDRQSQSNGLKPVIQAAVKTLVHYFPDTRELRVTIAVGMVMRSPAPGGLDGTPNAWICDPAGPLAGSRVRHCCAQSHRGDQRRCLQGSGGVRFPTA